MDLDSVCESVLAVVIELLLLLLSARAGHPTRHTHPQWPASPLHKALYEPLHEPLKELPPGEPSSSSKFLPSPHKPPSPAQPSPGCPRCQEDECHICRVYCAIPRPAPLWRGEAEEGGTWQLLRLPLSDPRIAQVWDCLCFLRSPLSFPQGQGSQKGGRYLRNPISVLQMGETEAAYRGMARQQCQDLPQLAVLLSEQCSLICPLQH